MLPDRSDVERAYARMMARVVICAATGCWLFNGARDKGSGHGKVRIRIFGVWKVVHAHRVSFWFHKGDVPKGMLIRHGCDTANCIKPDCLTLGSDAQNVYDMVMRGRGRNQYGPYGYDERGTAEIEIIEAPF